MNKPRKMPVKKPDPAEPPAAKAEAQYGIRLLEEGDVELTAGGKPVSLGDDIILRWGRKRV